MAADLIVGRRVDSFDGLTTPGAYWRTTVEIQGETEQSMWFVIPNAVDCEDHDGPCYGSIARVGFPPHTERECADGSLEVRASILVYARPGHPEWHGYLDEGHLWRSV